MIIASQLVRTDGQVRPDLVLRMLPPGVQRWVEVFNCLVAIAFTFGMVWYGWDVVSTAVLLDQRSSSDLQFPIWIYYTGAAGRRRADADALHHPAGALRVLFRSRGRCRSATSLVLAHEVGPNLP